VFVDSLERPTAVYHGGSTGDEPAEIRTHPQHHLSDFLGFTEAASGFEVDRLLDIAAGETAVAGIVWTGIGVR
jgi:hypothetical protein